MHILLICLISITIFQCVVSETCDGGNARPEVLLRGKLLCNYVKELRPVKDARSPVNVTVKMVLKTMDFSHEASAIDAIEIGSWMVMAWYDEFLKWNPSDYDGISQTIFDGGDIWIPDLSLFNQVEALSSVFQSPCVVQSNGRVVCIPHLSHKALCTSDYKKWPYDRQNCSLVFGTWMQSGEEVNFVLANTSFYTGDYEGNKFWKLIDVSAIRHPGNFKNKGNVTYPTLRFSIQIQRHSASLAAFFLVPALVLMLMTLSSIMMDIDSIERMSVMLLNVYCHFLYLQEISYMVPGNGDTLPNAVSYFRDSMVLCSFVLLHGVLMRGTNRKISTPPKWVTFTIGLMDTGAGKIMFHEFDPASFPSIVEEEAENLTKNESDASANKEWRRFVLFTNRVFFIIACLMYIGLALAFLL